MTVVDALVLPEARFFALAEKGGQDAKRASSGMVGTRQRCGLRRSTQHLG